MMLQLYIRGELLREMELPVFGPVTYLSPEKNFERKEDIIDWQVEVMKAKYCKLIENNDWEIYLLMGRAK